MKRQASGGKKTSFVANTSARAKNRPGVVRRKSSQGTAPQAKDQRKEPRSPVKSPVKLLLQAPSGPKGFLQLPIVNPARRGTTGPPPGLPPPLGLSSAAGAAFLLPSASSWQSVESTSPGKSGQGPVVENSMPLVDPNFHKQFVEARSASQLNLATAGGSTMRKTGSVVRFADDLSAEFGRGKARETSISGPGAGALRRGSVLDATRGSRLSGATAIDDTDEEGNNDNKEEDILAMLPRSRSQLILAIQEKRRVYGLHNLGMPDPRAGSMHTKSNGKGKAKEIDKEDTVEAVVERGPFIRATLPLTNTTSNLINEGDDISIRHEDLARQRPIRICTNMNDGVVTFGILNGAGK